MDNPPLPDGVALSLNELYLYSFQSLNYYGRQRTQNEKGVTIPSQRRYINYYERILKTPHLKYQPVYLYLRTIVLDPVPNFNMSPFGTAVDGCYLQVRIYF